LRKSLSAFEVIVRFRGDVMKVFRVFKVLIVLAALLVVSYNLAYWGFRLAGPKSTLIRDVTVVDGGGVAAHKDVLIRGGRVVEIGNLSPQLGTRVIEGGDLTLIPGLISFNYERAAVLNADYQSELLRHGVTTAVVSIGEKPEDLRKFINDNNYGPSAKLTGRSYVNLAPVLNYSDIIGVIGNSRELKVAAGGKDKWGAYLSKGLSNGAFAVHVNMRDLPGARISSGDLSYIADLVSRQGAFLSVTVSNHSDNFLIQTQKTIDLGLDKQVPVHIHDLVVSDPVRGGAALVMLADRQARGLDISTDRLPWLVQGNTLQRTVPEAEARFPKEQVYIIPNRVPETAVVTDLPPSEAGKLSRQPYGIWGPPAGWDPQVPGRDEVMFAPIVKKGGGWLGVSLGDVGLDEAVLRMSLLPARRLGLSDRGVIKKGAAADLVLLDRSLQVRSVWVNGKLLMKNGRLTGAASGSVLKRTGQ